MALKPTTCKDAIIRWEKKHEQSAAEAKVIELQFQWPPIEKMDGETVADTLEELWISYNQIDKLKGLGVMKNLKECKSLQDLVFIGNPLYDNQPDVDTWRTQASNRLQQITKLDGIPIVRE
ncbi:unnamed protein product [Leptidea sinapis]|uniref:Dynein light chain 1, axonemal n=1 Tax=Leptidea sinapis TaxID=189913 RepID=A0A5E4R2H2_9NEOP|nr:unnamed protein product [Leptidea sinapis]